MKRLLFLMMVLSLLGCEKDDAKREELYGPEEQYNFVLKVSLYYFDYYASRFESDADLNCNVSYFNDGLQYKNGSKKGIPLNTSFLYDIDPSVLNAFMCETDSLVKNNVFYSMHLYTKGEASLKFNCKKFVRFRSAKFDTTESDFSDVLDFSPLLHLISVTCEIPKSLAISFCVLSEAFMSRFSSSAKKFVFNLL